MSNNTNTYGSNDLEYYYDYDPSVGGNAFFMIAFIFFGAILSFKSIASKRYSMLYCAGFCFLEACGYLARLLFALEDDPLKSKYYAQIILMLIAPYLLQAYCYHMISEFLIWTKHFSDEVFFKRYAEGLPYRLSMGDCIGLTIQCIGAGILAEDDISSDSDGSGKTTVVMSFIVQLILLIAFTSGLLSFLYHNSSLERKLLSIYSNALVITLLCSMIRCIYRIAEINGGSFTTGSLNKKEWSFFLFDSTCMLIPAIVMTIISMDNFPKHPTPKPENIVKTKEILIMNEDYESSK